MTNQTYHIKITRKNNQTAVLIGDAPIKDVYAMLYGAVDLVAKNTNKSVAETLSILSDLDKYAKSTNQN